MAIPGDSLLDRHGNDEYIDLDDTYTCSYHYNVKVIVVAYTSNGLVC